MIDFQKAIDEKMQQLRVVCRSQWDYVNYSQLLNWLDDNFGNDVEGKYYALNILLHTVYYKRKDIHKLIKYGLFEKIYGSIVKKRLLQEENIYLSNSEALALVNSLKRASFFVPLLDSNKPSESGNLFIGDLVHKLEIDNSQVAFHWDITENTLENKDLLIFVDDCIGSGKQLKKFWNSEKIQSIREICIKKGITIYYLVLLGYSKNLSVLQKEIKLHELEIVVCDLLTDKNRVFSPDNIIWDRESNERDTAIAYFDNLRKQRGVSFQGFKKLDFAVILSDRLPNWSLPIFWKETTGWKFLLKRKTSLL